MRKLWEDLAWNLKETAQLVREYKFAVLGGIAGAVIAKIVIFAAEYACTGTICDTCKGVCSGDGT